MYLDERTIRDIVSDQADNYWETLCSLNEKSCVEIIKERICEIFKRT